MKAIFKKNQIIITALAIMIAVVGYLNFARDKEAEEEREAALSAASNSYEDGDLEGENYADLSAEDLGEDQFFMYQVSDTGELVLTENMSGNLETSGDAAVTKAPPAVQEPDTMQPSDITPSITENPAATGLPENSKNTSKAQSDGTDGAKEADSDGTPGEAVFTSVTIQEGYFSTAKLNREQMRAKNKETLLSVVSDNTVADDIKQGAIDEIIALTARAEMENAAEILLEAKGYEGVVVSLSDTEADVVVNAASITEQQIAQIEDIVSRKTGISAEGIVITTVVMED